MPLFDPNFYKDEQQPIISGKPKPRQQTIVGFIAAIILFIALTIWHLM